jgi:hypothetical protein
MPEVISSRRLGPSAAPPVTCSILASGHKSSRHEGINGRYRTLPNGLLRVRRPQLEVHLQSSMAPTPYGREYTGSTPYTRALYLKVRQLLTW